MGSKKYVLFKILTIILFGIWSKSYAEVYRAVLELPPLLNTYKLVIHDLDEYIQKEDERIFALKKNLDVFKKEHAIAMEDIPNYLGNPINAFTLIKRLTIDLKVIENRANLTTEFIRNMINNHDDYATFPGTKDLYGAAIALRRLQDTNKLQVHELAEGKINGVPCSLPMSADDCFGMGHVLFNMADYNNSIEWTLKALSKYEDEVESNIYSFTPVDAMNQIISSYYKLGDNQSVLEWEKKSETIYPNYDYAQTNLSKLYEIEITDDMVTMSVQVPTVLLNDGNKIPVLGLGTMLTGSDWDEDLKKTPQTIYSAVKAGYRHIDTASLYRNEEQIGLGIKDVISKGLVKREDLFVTTKLWNDKHAQNQVIPALQESLKRLGLDYVDLYLVHSPFATNADGSSADIDFVETWKGMEEAKRLGLAKSIGVSNFEIEDIDRLWANCQIKPAVNQIEIHLSLSQESLVAHCQKLGIVVTAFTPFGFMSRIHNYRSYAPPLDFDDPTLTKISEKYGKNTSQVVLRYLLDRGIVPIPKTINKSRLRNNIDVFDFQLTPQEVATINKFNVNQSVYG